MGVGVDHDAGGVNLPGHVSNLLAAFGHHRVRVVLVELLHGDEGAEGLLQPAFLGLVVDLFCHLGRPLGLEFDEIRVD